MYFWKCWRDSSLYFFLFLIADVVCMSFLGGGFRAREAIGIPIFILGLTAIALGTVVAKEEFADSTLHFLFTKPRSRSYFVWMGWAAGCAQLSLVAMFTLIVWWIGFVTHGGTSSAAIQFFASSRQGDFAGTAINALLFYCLTYALTAMLRNGAEGAGLAVLTGMAWPGLRVLFHVQWHIELPSPGGAIGTLPIAACYVIWTVAALAMIAAAQWYTEAAEPK